MWQKSLFILSFLLLSYDLIIDRTVSFLGSNLQWPTQPVYQRSLDGHWSTQRSCPVSCEASSTVAILRFCKVEPSTWCQNEFIQEANHEYEYKIATTPSDSVFLATLPHPGTTDYHIAEKRQFNTINQLVKKNIACKLYRTHKFKYKYSRQRTKLTYHGP